MERLNLPVGFRVDVITVDFVQRNLDELVLFDQHFALLLNLLAHDDLRWEVRDDFVMLGHHPRCLETYELVFIELLEGFCLLETILFTADIEVVQETHGFGQVLDSALVILAVGGNSRDL